MYRSCRQAKSGMPSVPHLQSDHYKGGGLFECSHPTVLKNFGDPEGGWCGVPGGRGLSRGA